MNRRCVFAACDREGTRLFQAEPVRGWLCEEHFRQTLNAAAEQEAVVRRKFEHEWEEHLGKYLRENNLNLAELSEEQARQLNDEAERWIRETHPERALKKKSE